MDLVKYEEAKAHKFIQASQTYYGVVLVDGEWACTRCGTINPDLKEISKTTLGEITTFVHECNCGAYVIVETPRRLA